jgi:hypothetical protein
VEGKHFIYFVGAERTPRVPALLSQEGDVAELRCNLCSHGKLRALRGIRRHVTDKYATPSSLFSFWFLLIWLRHKILVPSAADWTRVERILRTTLPPPAEAVSERSCSCITLCVIYLPQYIDNSGAIPALSRPLRWRIEVLILARATHLLITSSWFGPSSAHSGRRLIIRFGCWSPRPSYG